MSTSNQKSQKESIPIYFTSHLTSKELLIGKTRLQTEKSKFKITTRPTQISGVKEFILSNDSNKNLVYAGRENHQDSNYVLMKCNSEGTEIMMYPANNWVNFFKSTKKPNHKEEDKEKEKYKEKERKERIKEKNSKIKKYFNFNFEVRTDEQKKRGKKKKGGVLDRNMDEKQELEMEANKVNYLDEFKEDSNSSLLDPDLKEESESETYKKEEKKKKEEEKPKEEKNEEEEEEEEDKDLDDESSLERIEKFESKYGNYDDFVGNKRERENSVKDKMEEELENLLRKKDRMTYDEIIIELKKNFDGKNIEKYIDDLLDKITSKFYGDDKELYYYLKK